MPVPTLHDALEDVVTVAHERARLRLKLLLLALAVLQSLSSLLDGGCLLLGGERRIEELDGDVSHRFAEHRFELAQGATTNLEPLVEAVVNPPIDRVLVDEVQDRDLLALLAQPVDTANALLKSHGVPR